MVRLIAYSPHQRDVYKQVLKEKGWVNIRVRSIKDGEYYQIDAERKFGV